MNKFSQGEKFLSILKKTGFFAFFVTRILTKFIGLAGGMIMARVLNKVDYGFYAYALNAYGIMGILADMGSNDTALQLCSENYDSPLRRDAFFAHAFRFSMIATAFSSVLLLASSFFYPYQFPETVGITTALFALPFLENMNRFILSSLQIHLENRLFARVNLFNCLIHYLILLPCALFFSFQGALLSDYLIQFIIMLYGLHVARELFCVSAPQTVLTSEDRRTFWNLSIATGFSNMATSSFIYLDVFLLSFFMHDAESIASYKVASTIPLALHFIPSAVSFYIQPRLARHIRDYPWIRKTWLDTLAALCSLNLCICGGGIVLSRWIIPLLYGSQYESASECFSILLVGYFFFGIRNITYTALMTQRKVKLNLVVVIISNLANITLDMVLIGRCGPVGAAWASSLVNILAALGVMVYFLLYLRRKCLSSPKR